MTSLIFRRLAVAGFAAGGLLLAGAAFAQGKYKEAPALAAEVKAGKLPPVASASLGGARKESRDAAQSPTGGSPGYNVPSLAENPAATHP